MPTPEEDDAIRKAHFKSFIKRVEESNYLKKHKEINDLNNALLVQAEKKHDEIRAKIASIQSSMKKDEEDIINELKIILILRREYWENEFDSLRVKVNNDPDIEKIKKKLDELEKNKGASFSSMIQMAEFRTKIYDLENENHSEFAVSEIELGRVHNDMDFMSGNPAVTKDSSGATSKGDFINNQVEKIKNELVVQKKLFRTLKDMWEKVDVYKMEVSEKKMRTGSMLFFRSDTVRKKAIAEQFLRNLSVLIEQQKEGKILTSNDISSLESDIKKWSDQNKDATGWFQSSSLDTILQDASKALKKIKTDFTTSTIDANPKRKPNSKP